MAEINIERKERHVWPWLLLGIALLLILAFVFWWRDDPDAVAGDLNPIVPGAVAAPGGTAGGTIAVNEGAIGDFLAYVDSAGTPSAGVAHNYTADGLRRLGAAIGALWNSKAGNDDAIRTELDAIRAMADSMQRNPQSTAHARFARDGARTAAALMSTVRQQHFADAASSQVGDARNAAQALNGDQVLLEQTSNVQRFFSQSAAAIRAMAGGTS